MKKTLITIATIFSIFFLTGCSEDKKTDSTNSNQLPPYYKQQKQQQSDDDSMKLMTFETYRFGMSKEEILSFLNTKEFSFSEKKGDISIETFDFKTNISENKLYKLSYIFKENKLIGIKISNLSPIDKTFEALVRFFYDKYGQTKTTDDIVKGKIWTLKDGVLINYLDIFDFEKQKLNVKDNPEVFIWMKTEEEIFSLVKKGII